MQANMQFTQKQTQKSIIDNDNKVQVIFRSVANTLTIK